MKLLLRWLARQVTYCEARVKDAEGTLNTARLAQGIQGNEAERIWRLERQLAKRERRLERARAARKALERGA